jgi:hypothetical protein
MKEKKAISIVEPVEGLIRLLRGQRVILNADLARVYGVPTKRLNEAVNRNPERFPSDFAFILKPQEVASLRSQIATSKGRGGRRYIPVAFTEYGAIMAANVLNGPRAVQMSVFVVRVPRCGMKMREIGFHVRDEAQATLRSSRGDEAQTNTRPNHVRASSRRLLQF